MTAPLSLPPSCVLYVDGVRYNDGQIGESPTDPVALDDLRVVWGRGNTLDQPTPSTLTFTVLDAAGGQRFLDGLHIGAWVDVTAEATIYPDPTISTIPALLPGPSAQLVISGTSSVQKLAGVGPGGGWVIYPPAAYSADPSAWDAIPRALAGQSWRLDATVTFPAPFAGWDGWAAEIGPWDFRSPAGPWAAGGRELPDKVTLRPSDPPMALTFIPPAGAWLGLIVRYYPTSPAWDELDDTTWDELPAGGSPRTNRATNPRAVSTGADGWTSFRGFGGGAAGTYSYATGITGPAGTGITTCRRKTWTVGSNTVINDTGHDVRDTSALYFPVTPGQTVTISGWLRMTSATPKPAQVAWVFYNALTNAGANVGAGTGPVVTLTSGQWARITATAVVPAGAVGLRVVLDVDGNGSAIWAAGDTLDATGLLIEVAPAVGSYFDGSTPDVPGVSDYAWAGTVNASTSTAVSSPAVTWDDLATITLSSVKMLAPTAGALRAGSVVSGRITDLTAQYDIDKGATLVDVIVQSHLAELGNRFVGDTPWTVESLGSRFAKIVTGSGQAINYTIDPTVTGVPVSWRDVDRQPAASLLQELAKSVGGALWSAASLVTGPYLWLEDINQRPSMYVLQEDAGGVVRIVLRTTVEGSNVIEIDACSVLLDPVQWTQTTEDNSTRVVIAWQLQGVDDKGQPKVTATDETAVDPEREAATGQRRIQITTQLSQQPDAARVANSILGRVVTPGWRISGLTIELAHEPLDAELLAAVMSILDGSTRIGLGILLTNLPAWSPVGTQQVGLFLEGGRFVNADGAWTLELVTSAAEAQGQADVAWDELPADWIWNDFDPAISWNDLAGVGI